MSTKENRRRVLRIFLNVAMPAVEAMRNPERADAYEGIAVAAQSTAPEISTAALAAAKAIRESESQQLLFKTLFAKG
jgi:hypothetical protein